MQALHTQTIDAGEAADGFTITFQALVEYDSLEMTFDDNIDDLDELRSKIETGELVWFCARVVASWDGIELGSDTLGSCLYDSFESFYENPDEDYIADMIAQAVEEANKAWDGMQGSRT